ncbi:Uncharacterised protein [Staphylococcus aureus]|nr:Uncharacterised protein [Staphylococcus aureus]
MPSPIKNEVFLSPFITCDNKPVVEVLPCAPVTATEVY